MIEGGKLNRVDLLSLIYVSISFTGLSFLAIFTFNSRYTMQVPSQKPLVGISFIALCISGIIAGIFPSQCSNRSHSRKAKKIDRKEPRKTRDTIQFEGHHPPCGNFPSHVLNVGGKTYCAGCTGLIVGAALSILATGCYFFHNLVGVQAQIVFWMGYFCVAAGLLQYSVLDFKNSVVHFFLNILFVLGALFLLIGIGGLNDSLFIVGYFFTLAIYLIIVRIILSNLEHEKICRNCHLKNCSFSLTSQSVLQRDC